MIDIKEILYNILMKAAFMRLNAWCDKHPCSTPEELDRYFEEQQEEYDRWLKSEGFNSQQELIAATFGELTLQDTGRKFYNIDLKNNA